MEYLKKLIGKQVVKYPSNKPFKSGFKTNTVKGIITHEITGLPAFTFVEDDSYVEVRQCLPKNFTINFSEVQRLYPNCKILGISEFYSSTRNWTQNWDDGSKLKNSKSPVEDQIKRCWMENGKTIMLRIEHEGEIKEPDYKIDEIVTF